MLINHHPGRTYVRQLATVGFRTNVLKNMCAHGGIRTNVLIWAIELMYGSTNVLLAHMFAYGFRRKH